MKCLSWFSHVWQVTGTATSHDQGIFHICNMVSDQMVFINLLIVFWLVWGLGIFFCSCLSLWVCHTDCFFHHQIFLQLNSYSIFVLWHLIRLFPGVCHLPHHSTRRTVGLVAYPKRSCTGRSKLFKTCHSDVWGHEKSNDMGNLMVNVAFRCVKVRGVLVKLAANGSYWNVVLYMTVLSLFSS